MRPRPVRTVFWTGDLFPFPRDQAGSGFPPTCLIEDGCSTKGSDRTCRSGSVSWSVTAFQQKYLSTARYPHGRDDGLECHEVDRPPSAVSVRSCRCEMDDTEFDALCAATNDTL